MIIRNVKPEDIDELIKIHQVCFPKDYRTKLGFMKCYFKEYISRKPQYFFVAEDNGCLIGYVQGWSHWLRSLDDDVKKHYFFYLLLRKVILLFKRDKNTWQNIWLKLHIKKPQSITRKKMTSKFDHVNGAYVAWAAYLAVLPEYRKTGVAWQLMRLYEDIMRDEGMKAMFVGVNQDNKRVKLLYGYRGYESIYEDENSALMARML